jgi:heme A synthase
MRPAWLAPIGGGVASGVALSAYARSGNGFQVGPGMLLFLALLALVATVGIILVAWGGRGRLGKQFIVFALTAFAMLLLLAIMWPYPAPDPPVPLT